MDVVRRVRRLAGAEKKMVTECNDDMRLRFGFWVQGIRSGMALIRNGNGGWAGKGRYGMVRHGMVMGLGY